MDIIKIRLTSPVRKSDWPKPGESFAFTRTDLLVLVAILGILALSALPALGSAKVNSRQMFCLSNLRQLGIASRMYVVEYRQYTGDYSPLNQAYVWPKRLFDYTVGGRKVFSCPAAIPSARWDTNLNTTLGSFARSFDPYGVTSTTRFSYGLNDWGLSISVSPQLGLGGDIDGGFYRGPVRDSDVVAPAQMIMLADVPAFANRALINFGANLDPTSSGNPISCQWPSNRHHYLIDMLFTDGHTETPTRLEAISPVANNPWRNRWNNDNRSHNEVTWSLNSVGASTLDPSY